jgi:hypothetical protein
MTGETFGYKLFLYLLRVLPFTSIVTKTRFVFLEVGPMVTVEFGMSWIQVSPKAEYPDLDFS